MIGGGTKLPTLGEVSVVSCLMIGGAGAVFLYVALSRYP